MNCCWLRRLATGLAALFSLLLFSLPSTLCGQTYMPVTWIYSPITQANCSAFSPDNSLIAVTGVGGVQVFNVSTGSLVSCLPIPSVFGNSVVFSPDGTTLAIGGGNYDSSFGSNVGAVELWNVSNFGFLLLKILASSITSMLFIVVYLLLFTKQSTSRI